MNGRGIKRPFNNPVWGQPGFNPMQQDMNMQRNGWGGGPMMGGVGPMMGVGGGPMMADSPMVHPLMSRMGEQKETSSNRIKVLFDPSVKKTTLEKIFNIVPGFVSLEFIEMVTKGAVAGVTYDNPLSAQHAIERIQGLEYPADSPLELDMVPAEPEAEVQQQQQEQQQPMKEYLPPAFDAQRLSSEDLPGTKPLAKGMGEGDVVKTVFFSINKRGDDNSLPPVEQQILLYRNLFCRFGNLFKIHVMKGHRNGLAKFTKKESADDAIKALDDTKLGIYKFSAREFFPPREDGEGGKGGTKSKEGEEGTKSKGEPKKGHADRRRNQMDDEEWEKKETDASELSSVDLPEPIAMEREDHPVAKSVFFCLFNVEYGGAKLPPFSVYSNLFRRFGNLIKICRIGDRKGLACYAAAENADQAIKALHDSKLGGISLNVREYEERGNSTKKRNLKKLKANLEEY